MDNQQTMEIKEKVLWQISETRSKVFPNDEGEVFLFGSRARGDYQSNSDWDLLILTPDRIDSQNDFDILVSPFSELGWKLDVEINPIQYSKADWVSRKGSPFYDNVMRDAIKI